MNSTKDLRDFQIRAMGLSGHLVDELVLPTSIAITPSYDVDGDCRTELPYSYFDTETDLCARLDMLKPFMQLLRENGSEFKFIWNNDMPYIRLGKVEFWPMPMQKMAVYVSDKFGEEVDYFHVSPAVALQILKAKL